MLQREIWCLVQVVDESTRCRYQDVYLRGAAKKVALFIRHELILLLGKAMLSGNASNLASAYHKDWTAKHHSPLGPCPWPEPQASLEPGQPDHVWGALSAPVIGSPSYSQEH